MVTPDTSSSRIVELDALRGLAVLGIVWMNVYVFALPLQAYYNPTVFGGESSADQFVWLASFVFFEDKFRTLFAMLFGAGCLILIERSGEKPWRAHFARMAVLMAIGIAHSTLLASNDVLRAYALAGLAIPLLAGLTHRVLYVVAIGLVAVHVGAGIFVFGSAVVDSYAGRVDSDVSLWAARRFGSDEGALSYALELGREGLGERIIRRLESLPGQLTTITASIPLNLAAMALGMAMWKDRMLAGQWRIFKLQRIAAICALIALPSLLMLAYWAQAGGFAPAFVGAASLVFSAPFDTLLGFAYAALAMAFFAPGGIVTQRLAAVGRLSLTNYLMTSVVLAAIFASWGLGMFAQVSRAQAFVISFAPIVAMLIWSPLWLKQLGQGPFERLWRWSAARFS